MMTGLKSRLIEEVKLLQQHPKYSSQICIKALKVHRPPAKANYVAWLGGDVSKFISLSFDNFMILVVILNP